MRVRLPLLLALLLPVAALAQAPLQVKAAPASVVLGRDAQVTLSISREDGAPPHVEAAASAGVLVHESAEGAPVALFRYTPPDVRHPLWATLLFWEPGPGAQRPSPAVLRLPLLGRTTLDIATEPDAQVVVQVQRARFGPVRASPQGLARIAVEVPPGVRSARVLATAHGEQTEREVQLDVPPARGLAALLGPGELAQGETAWLAVAGEETLTPEALELTVEGGQAELQEGRPLLYRVTPAAGATSLRVQLRRRSGEDALSLEAAVLPAPAAPVAPPPAPEPTAPRALSLFALGGAYFAGGANTGPALALGLRHALPALSPRLSVEGEVGLRRAGFTPEDQAVQSRVLAVPLLLSLHLQLLERGALSLGARAGGGLSVFQHRVQREGQSDYTEGGLDPAAFLALQGAYRLGPVALLLEARGSLQPATTPRLDAQLGGLTFSLGVRYLP